MAGDDPFRGLKLSEQAGVGKIEQSLFTPQPTPPPPAPKPDRPPEPEKAKPPAKPAPPSGSLATTAKPKSSPAPAARFDLNEDPLYKASFLFTQEELEALEDLKLELRREYDTKVTKNDLARAAFHLLLEDHADNGAQSYASRKIRKRGVAPGERR